jgi:large subunit ribosomal protein L30
MVDTNRETIVVRLKRGLAGCNERQRATVRSLGLKRVGMTVTLPRNPAIEGRIAKVRHLIEVRG